MLYGESLGTGVAVQMGTEHANVVGLVLEAPFTRLPDLAPVYVLPGVAELLVLDRYDNRAKIGQIRAPMLIMHGQQDGVVPVSMGRELKERARMGVEAHFLAGAGHNDLYSHGAGELVINFIRKQIEP